MIIDTFLYAGEEDLLEIRLIELAEVVDEFIPIASVETFRGTPIDIRTDRFVALCDAYPVIDVTLEASGTPFEREHRARGFVDQIAVNCEPDALILHGDVDELPRFGDVLAASDSISTTDPGFYIPARRLRGDLHQLAIDWWLEPRSGDLHPDAGVHPFAGPVIATARTTAEVGTLALRQNTHLAEYRRAGWHLQWVMRPEECVRKIQSAAHAEFDRAPYNKETFWVTKRREGVDPFDRWTLSRIPSDAILPRAFRDPEIAPRFAHLRAF